VFQLFFSNPPQPLLRAYVVITVLGFATVPSYLYFFSAQLVLFACLLLYERKFDGALLRALVFIGIGVYLFYLPALCFSGKHALTGNEYVQSHSGDYVDFMPWFYITLKMFVESIFSFFIQPDHIINMWLFLTPLLLLFSRRKRDRLIVIFYIFLWLSWGCITFYMQRFAFSRSMTIHYSISLSIVVFTVYRLIEQAFRFLKHPAANNWAVGLVLASAVAWFCVAEYNWCFKEEHFTEEANYGAQIRNDIQSFGPMASVGCSPNGFCYYYYARQLGHPVSFCASGSEQYYINYHTDSLPPVIASQYVLLKKGAVNCDIYQRK